jgi:hypothetical protein
MFQSRAELVCLGASRLPGASFLTLTFTSPAEIFLFVFAIEVRETRRPRQNQHLGKRRRDGLSVVPCASSWRDECRQWRRPSSLGRLGRRQESQDTGVSEG